jgi:hypothetical protein
MQQANASQPTSVRVIKASFTGAPFEQPKAIVVRLGLTTMLARFHTNALPLLLCNVVAEALGHDVNLCAGGSVARSDAGAAFTGDDASLSGPSHSVFCKITYATCISKAV